MPKVRDTILMAYARNLIDDIEYLFLYNVKFSRKSFYSILEPRTLQSGHDDRQKMQQLTEVLNPPGLIVCYNDVNMDTTQALYIFLRRFACPSR